MILKILIFRNVQIIFCYTEAATKVVFLRKALQKRREHACRISEKSFIKQVSVIWFIKNSTNLKGTHIPALLSIAAFSFVTNFLLLSKLQRKWLFYNGVRYLNRD